MGNQSSNNIQKEDTLVITKTQEDQYSFIPTLTEFEGMQGPHPKFLALAEALGNGFDSGTISFQDVVDRLDNVFFWPGETRESTMMAWMAMKHNNNPNSFI